MKKKKKAKIDDNKKYLIICIIYFILMLSFSLIFHEKWRDEAQAFLLARDLDIIGLFKELSYEGHPPLWYLIIMPFAKLGFSYNIMSVLSCFFMSVGHFLLLTKSPFRSRTKLLIMLLAPSVVFALVSRSYSLIPLALYLIAINYKDRHINKMKYAFCLIFLLYTHILMLGLVAALYIQFGIEELFLIKKDRKELKSFIKVFIVSCFFVIGLGLLLYGGPGKNVLVIRLVKLKSFVAIIKIISGFAFYKDNLVVFLFLVLPIYFIFCGFKYNIKEVLVVLVAFLFQFFIYRFIYYPDYQKSLLMEYFIVFYFWIIYDNQKKYNKIALIAGLILIINNIMVGYCFGFNDYKEKFSGSKDAGSFIEKNTKDGSVFVATEPYLATAVVPYTNNKRFWNPYSKKDYTFIKQDKYSLYDYSSYELLDIINNSFDNTDNVYILFLPINYELLSVENTNSYFEMEKEGLITRIFSNEKEPSREDEFYIIYKINKGE